MSQAELIAWIEAGERSEEVLSLARAALERGLSGSMPDDLTTDAVISTIESALPSWSLHVQGQSAAVAGRWTATIRESGVRDDDELIGVGKAARLENALLAALIQIAELRGS